MSPAMAKLLLPVFLLRSDAVAVAGSILVDNQPRTFLGVGENNVSAYAAPAARDERNLIL